MKKVLFILIVVLSSCSKEKFCSDKGYLTLIKSGTNYGYYAKLPDQYGSFNGIINAGTTMTLTLAPGTYIFSFENDNGPWKDTIKIDACKTVTVDLH